MVAPKTILRPGRRVTRL